MNECQSFYWHMVYKIIYIQIYTRELTCVNTLTSIWLMYISNLFILYFLYILWYDACNVKFTRKNIIFYFQMHICISAYVHWFIYIYHNLSHNMMRHSCGTYCPIYQLLISGKPQHAPYPSLSSNPVGIGQPTTQSLQKPPLYAKRLFWGVVYLDV